MRSLTVALRLIWIPILLLAGGLVARETLSDGSRPAAAWPELTPQEVRARLGATGQLELAERIIASAYAEAVERHRQALRLASDEAGLLEVADAIRADSRIEAAARDRLDLVLARRLAVIGSSRSLLRLDAISRRAAAVRVRVPGCRRPVLIPLFPFSSAAREATHRIEVREAIAAFERLSADSRQPWILDATRTSAPPARLQAALEVIRRWGTRDPTARSRWIAGLVSSLPERASSAGELLVEAYLGVDELPSRDLFARLPLAAAQRFLETAWRDSSRSRHDLLRLARAHDGLASLATFLEGEGDLSDPREVLERGGASGAAILGRSVDPDRTRALEAIIIGEPGASSTLRRQAALALVLQGTGEARRALERRLLAGDLPVPVAEKIGRWLEHRDGRGRR